MIFSKEKDFISGLIIHIVDDFSGIGGLFVIILV